MMNVNTISSAIGDATQLSASKKIGEAEPQSLIRDQGDQSRQPVGRVEQAGVANPNPRGNEVSDKKTTQEGIDKAVADVNEFFQNEHRKLSFSINEALEGVVIEVKDSDTDEVIRQIPPESVVKLAERLSELNAKEEGVVGVFLKEFA